MGVPYSLSWCPIANREKGYVQVIIKLASQKKRELFRRSEISAHLYAAAARLDQPTIIAKKFETHAAENDPPHETTGM